MKKNMKIKERTYQFALEIIKLTRKMPKDTTGFVLGNQLMKSGSSVGANVEEATNLKNILSAIVKTSKEGKGRKVKAGS